MRLGATLTRAEEAERLADAGFDGLWVPQLIGRGTFVPDPFVTLAAAATAVPHVEVGTATVQVPLHHPADLAYRIQSLHEICGDRLTIGLSPGSTAADYELLDRDFTTRFQVFDRNVPRLRTLLGENRPPLLLGSWGAKVAQAARDFDGWLAADHRRTPEQIIAAHDRYRAAGGRRALVCAIRLTTPADLGPVGDRLHRYEQAGFDDAIVWIGPDGPQPAAVKALL